MGKYFRLSIVLILILVLTLLASSDLAWAGTGKGAGDVNRPAAGAGQAEVSADKPEPGTVKPPPGEVSVCEKNGIFSVGGVAVLQVNNLAPGYCLVAFLREHAFAVGRIPTGAGEVLADITFLRIFYHGELVYELPREDGQVIVCYAVPPGKTAQIYFLNFYGPRFGQAGGQPSWEPLETTVENGIACAPAQTTGAYALIGK